MQHKLASTKLSIFALKHQFHVTTGERTFSVLEHLLHLAMRADNTAAGLSVLAECILLTSDSGTCRTDWQGIIYTPYWGWYTPY